MKYKSIFISDIHLGSKASQAESLLKFLKNNSAENLFLVGDIIDGWALSKTFYWPQKHNNVIQRILKIARTSNVYYLPGNHDEFLRTFGEHNFGNIQLLDMMEYDAINGKKYIIMHGDQFDIVIKKLKWLAHMGAWAYDTLIALNVMVSTFRNIFGLPYWSLSAWAKYKVKTAVNFIGEFEENLSNFAESKDANGIICGHIHHANIRQIGNIEYINCGDWVESCTAIVEHYDGKMELIEWDHKNSV